MSQSERVRAQEEQAELLVELRLHELLRAMALADIKAPLTEIALSARVVERMAQSESPQLAEAIQDIRDAASRTLALLSALSDEGDGAPSVDLRINGLAELVAAAARAVDPLARARQVGIETAVGHERTLCDRARTVRALTTLLGVAVRRTPPGAAVRVEVAHDDFMLHVLVKDRGDMMSEDEIERTLSPAVIEAAWPPSRDAATARRVITLQGGTLRVRRAPEGMVFDVAFPSPASHPPTR